MELLGIDAYSFHAPFGDRIDITSLNRHERNASVQEVLAAAEAAAQLKARYLVIHPGPEHIDHAPDPIVSAGSRTAPAP